SAVAAAAGPGAPGSLSCGAGPASGGLLQAGPAPVVGSVLRSVVGMRHRVPSAPASTARGPGAGPAVRCADRRQDGDGRPEMWTHDSARGVVHVTPGGARLPRDAPGLGDCSGERNDRPAERCRAACAGRRRGGDERPRPPAGPAAHRRGGDGAHGRAVRRAGRAGRVGARAEVAALDHWPHGAGRRGARIANPAPTRVPELADDARAALFPAGPAPMHTSLGGPVRVRETVFGNLYLTDKQGPGGAREECSAEDEAAVVALAAAAGVAIENARLYGRAKQVGVLEDRDRIARDLHDVVIQRLFASAMTLMSVQPLVTDPNARTRIEETVSDLDETIRQIRSTIFALHT